MLEPTIIVVVFSVGVAVGMYVVSQIDKRL